MTQHEKHDEIIKATVELIAEHGFHGAPMATIAERAGVAAGTIYRYFENKDVLIRETYVCLERKIQSAMMDGYPEERPIRERFLHLGQRLIAYMVASPLEFRFVEQFHNSPYGADCRRDRIFGSKEKDIVSKLFEEGRKQQLIKNLPLPILTALTFGPLVNICRDHLVNLIVLDEQLISRAVESCWDAVKC